MQFGVSIRHCHDGIQLTETFGRVRGYKMVVHDHHDRSADHNELLNSF